MRNDDRSPLLFHHPGYWSASCLKRAFDGSHPLDFAPWSYYRSTMHLAPSDPMHQSRLGPLLFSPAQRSPLYPPPITSTKSSRALAIRVKWSLIFGIRLAVASFPRRCFETQPTHSSARMTFILLLQFPNALHVIAAGTVSFKIS